MTFIVDNVPAIIQRRLSEEEIRQEVREECARFLESLTRVRLHPLFRGLQGEEVDADGFQEIKRCEKQLLMSAAQAIREGRK
jgi:hypothetical protein